jgi:hypothetical protein
VIRRIIKLLAHDTRLSPWHPRRARLSVDGLENRAMPASFTAATVADLIADINAANASGGPNSITLATGARFTLTAVDNTADGPTGLPVVAANDDLTILGNGNIIERSTAAGTPQFRLLDVAAGGSLALENLTLQGGRAYGFLTALDVVVGGRGGAVFSQGGLTLDGVTVQNNSAHGADWNSPTLNAGGGASGGGVCSTGSLAVTNSTIRNNSAVGGHAGPGTSVGGYLLAGESGGTGLGGGLFVDGVASISGSTITGNTAQGGTGGVGYTSKTTGSSDGGEGGWGAGGAIYVLGTVSIDGTSITANTALGGTGGTGYSAQASITNGGEGGFGLGGGLFADFNSVTTIRTSLISSNTATGGAGGVGGSGKHHSGNPGNGVGGGFYITPGPGGSGDIPGADVRLDTDTVARATGNHASTSSDDIFGPYSVIV